MKRILPAKRLEDPGLSCYFRLRSKTKIIGECWIWQGYKDKLGYGQIRVAGRTLWAHRVAFACYYGVAPADTQLDHLCNNPSCVNPTHLTPSSQSDNIARSNRRRASKNRDKVPF